jgi:hypothetical protein
MVIAGAGPVMRQGRDIMAADRPCILVAVVISVITVVTMAVITVVAVTTVVVVIKYLSSARPSVMQADRDLPVRFFQLSLVRTAAENPNGFKHSVRVAAENIVCINF